MSDQQRKGTSTIIKGFARRGNAGRQDTEEPGEQLVAEDSHEAPERAMTQEAAAPLVKPRDEVVSYEPLRFDRQPEALPDTRLSVAPLSTLLPRFGKVGRLDKFRNHIVKRNALLQQARRENTEERAGRQSAEELMLSQLMVWLGEEDGGEDE